MARRRWILFIEVGAYLTALQLSYIVFISPKFTYLGYSYAQPSGVEIAVAWATAALPVAYMPTALTRPSEVALWLLYTLAYVPASIFPYLVGISDPARLGWWSVSLTMSFGLAVFVAQRRANPRLHLALPQPVFWSFLVLLLGLAMAMILLRTGLSLDASAFASAYDARFEYRAIVEGSGGLPYAVGAVGNVVAPILIAYGLVKRVSYLVVGGVLLELALFLLTGYRSLLLAPFLILILLAAAGVRSPRTWFGNWIVGGALGVIVVAISLDGLSGSLFFSSLFVRRLIVTPGVLSGFYLEFFSQAPKAMLGHSIFSGLMDYPYAVSPAFLIGERYLGNPQTSANANVFADGFANFGYVGVVAAGGLVGLFLWLFDSVSSRIDLRLSALLMGTAAFTLANTGLITTLFTHGIALAFLLMFLAPTGRLRRRALGVIPPGTAGEPRKQDVHIG